MKLATANTVKLEIEPSRKEFDSYDRVLHRNGKPAAKIKGPSRESVENIILLTAATGDFVVIVLGFVLANLLCQSRWVPAGWQNMRMPYILENYKVILAGSVVVFCGLAGRELYSYRSLLSPSRIWQRMMAALGFCLMALTAISVIVQTNPPIPWTFFACAALIIFAEIYPWRLLFSQVVQHPALASRLRRRVVVIGGGTQTKKIQKTLGKNSDMEFVGWVEAIKPNHVADLEKYRLGALHELGSVLRRHKANVAVLMESDSLQREAVLCVARVCENESVQFKMVPHFFDILISGLRPETIGGVELLGVDCLPLNGYRNRLLKRMVDIVGGVVGLLLSIPLVLIFGALVYRESPGPILYRQIRQGRNGRLFSMIKIRSMHMDAEVDGCARWAQEEDPRRLRIGAFMRKWNIDEVPQFWNVLCGAMSLVGPRPERPELIDRFKSKILHYQARHICRPGMTGWAQINGWRGNTDLEQRISHDIWYFENWSIWLDFRIMARTLFCRLNAY